MAKGKKGKDKKGKDKKPKEEEPQVTNVMPEIDKTFYEIQITDLNRRLARLRSINTKLEEKTEELEKNIAKIDEDRNDVIIFLKRMLQEKTEEVAEYQQKFAELEETRNTDTVGFQEKVQEMQNDYTVMHEQLSSEVKLLTGKLNSLEEFRNQRDELMKKFEAQENETGEHELRHKREIYEIEKKFVIGKHNLKKEMETRLLQLSSEFQDVTEIRIASTTHRVIRENIAINNELNAMLETHKRLYQENESLKGNNLKLKLDASLHEEEKKRALAKVSVQYKLIDKLTGEHEKMTEKLRRYHNAEAEMFRTRKEKADLKIYSERLLHNIRLLEQNLQASRCERANLKLQLDYSEGELERLSAIINEAAMSIKVALKKTVRTKHDKLLENLRTLLTTVQDRLPQPSLESVQSVSVIYEQGDLGFIPKKVIHRSKVPVRRNVEVQITPSFEEMVAQYNAPVSEKESDLSASEHGDMEAVADVLSTVSKPVEHTMEKITTIFDESTESEVSEEEEEQLHYVDMSETALIEQLGEEESEEGEMEKTNYEEGEKDSDEAN